jgi:hypothetical protein
MWSSTFSYRQLKQLRVLVNHKFNIWENEVAPKVLACLDELNVEWTSLDIASMPPPTPLFGLG